MKNRRTPRPRLGITPPGFHSCKVSTAVYTQLQSLALAQSHGISTLSVNALAASPTAPISPDPLRYLLAALVGGLCLSVLAALLVSASTIVSIQLRALPMQPVCPYRFSAIQRRAQRQGKPRGAKRLRPSAESVMARNPRVEDVDGRARGGAGPGRRHRDRDPHARMHGGQKVIIVRADADAAGIPQMTTSNSSASQSFLFRLIPDARQAVGSLANGAGPYDFTVFSMRSPQVDPSAIALASTAKLADAARRGQENPLRRGARHGGRASSSWAGRCSLRSGSASGLGHSTRARPGSREPRLTGRGCLVAFPGAHRGRGQGTGGRGTLHRRRPLRSLRPLLPLRYVRDALETWRYLATANPSVVVVVSPPVFAPLTAWLWCSLRRRPLVIDCHTLALHSPKWGGALPLHRFLMRRSRVVRSTPGKPRQRCVVGALR